MKCRKMSPFYYQTPSPSKYMLPGTLGDLCPTNRCYPAYSMGAKIKDIHHQGSLYGVTNNVV